MRGTASGSSVMDHTRCKGRDAAEATVKQHCDNVVQRQGSSRRARGSDEGQPQQVWQQADSGRVGYACCDGCTRLWTDDKEAMKAMLWRCCGGEMQCQSSSKGVEGGGKDRPWWVKQQVDGKGTGWENCCNYTIVTAVSGEEGAEGAMSGQAGVMGSIVMTMAKLGFSSELWSGPLVVRPQSSCGWDATRVHSSALKRGQKWVPLILRVIAV